MEQPRSSNVNGEDPAGGGIGPDDSDGSVILYPHFELEPGTRLDRIGGLTGSYLWPEGTPLTERSLPPDCMTAPYYVFEVTDVPLPRGWMIRPELVVPWFGQEGGGTQYRIIPPVGFNGGVILWLLEAGYIVEVGR